MKGFGEKVDAFMESNREIKECVRIFDETISQKASKAELLVLKEKSDNEFVKVSTW